MKNSLIILLVFLVALLSIPLVMTVTEPLTSYLLNSGRLQTNRNYDGGMAISRSIDPANDLLQPVPAPFSTCENALDIRAFTVTKVEFSRLAGHGIAPRLNLMFEFDGRLPNPCNRNLQFSLPAILVFIGTPGQSSYPASPSRIPKVAFTGQGWNFKLCIDGLHEQARIYDTNDKLIGESLSLLIEHRKAEQSDWVISKIKMPDKKQEDVVTSTRLTVALPLNLIGDPAVSGFNFYVLVGLPDLQSPGGMAGLPFDCFNCRLNETDGVIEIQPLSVGPVP